MKTPCIALLLLLGCNCLLTAETRVSQLFGPHMVVQADKPVAIWGWDDPGQRVTIGFAGHETVATTDAHGAWRASLPALPPDAKGQPLTISGSSSITLDDVLIGEVWCLMGRSNVSFKLAWCADGEAIAASADHPQIRMVGLFGDPGLEPQEDVTTRGWHAISPRSAKNMSGIAYFFTTALQRERAVPVGLVQNNWGGSPGSMWIRRDIFEKAFPKGGTPALDWLQDFEASSRDFHEHGKGVREYGDGKGDRIGTLYPSRIEPMLGFSCRGIIFYCSGTTAQQTEVVGRSWRQAWGEAELPFLYVQIPPSGGAEESDLDKRCGADRGFRASFMALDASGRLAKACMVTANGTQVPATQKRNIHPPNKQPLGERLVRAARALAYGEDIQATGPLYRSHRLQGPDMVISFANADGLAADGDSLTGFAASADGQSWHPATARIEGATVIVSADGIVAKQVCYAMGYQAVGNLVNADGLPAATFSTAVAYP